MRSWHFELWLNGSCARANESALAGDKGVSHREEFSFIMTIACPLCANTNEVLSQPSSISWKQVACSSCEANLVLVRESSSRITRHPLTSAIRLMSPLSGARPRAAVVRSRLFIALATALVISILVYLSWEAGLFESYVPAKPSVLSSTALFPASPRSLPTADGSVTK